jgi:hypothetical protein
MIFQDVRSMLISIARAAALFRPGATFVRGISTQGYPTRLRMLAKFAASFLNRSTCLVCNMILAGESARPVPCVSRARHFLLIVSFSPRV